ncbi:CHASE2 domain-containing protein [Leptolyngbyaceae cyanobacterium UHCC 1019]
MLKFEGDLTIQGFQVTLEIRSELNQIEVEERGQLAPNTALMDALQDWQEKYRNIGAPTRIKPKRILYDGSIQKRRADCNKAAANLRDRFTNWLKSDSFRSVDLQLREELHRDEEVRLLLRSADQTLQKLPWHEWDFVQRYPNTEVVLTSLNQRSRKQSAAQPTQKNRVLAILGHSHGIDVTADRQLLEGLSNSDVTFLVEPQRQQLGDRLWEQPWDVIFFAGHSETEGETGRIYLNPTDSLTIEELWFALRKAVDRGLKLAIFNSCDGLGLVQQLNDLAIPHLIVMRELVPDRVAQEFLKYLLTALSDAKPVHLAMREARERLETLEDEFPCATWLPVIHQNVDYTPVTLLKPAKFLPVKQVLLVSLAVTLLVMGIRWIGFLQSAELQAYDHLMRSRPVEQPDPRLLLVSIDEEDIRQYKHPISDSILATVIEKLQQEKPIAIGVNITRDMPVEKGYARFVNLLRQNQSLITTCGFENPFSRDKSSINPPPNAPSKQVGFNNVITDWQWNNQNNAIRRQLLSRTENPVSSFSKCDAEYSFGLLLAANYLKSRRLSIQVNERQEWELGKVASKD